MIARYASRSACGGKQPQVFVALAELVDQVLPMDAVGRLSPASDVVADGGQGQHQGRQPLLTVDHQPALHPGRLQRRTRCDDHRTHEVRACGVQSAIAALCSRCRATAASTVVAPAVGALVQRNLELLLALDKVEKAHFVSSHSFPSCSDHSYAHKNSLRHSEPPRRAGDLLV